MLRRSAMSKRLCSPVAGWSDELIYLWGQPGVGRSHLLQAACLRVEERGELAVYLPLAEVAEYGPALLDNLEQSELVCLDDLDAVAGDATWEEALFHLFNRLRDAGRRLLLAADASPRELAIKLPDLQSRLSLALVFQLQQLSDEDKLRALQLRASRRGELAGRCRSLHPDPRLAQHECTVRIAGPAGSGVAAGAAQADHPLPQGNPGLVEDWRPRIAALPPSVQASPAALRSY